MGDRSVRRTHAVAMLPAFHDPSASPSMNTDTTTESTGVMIPNDRNASRSQTIWYTRPQKPESTNSRNRICVSIGACSASGSGCSLAGLLIAYNINLRQVSSYDTYASRFVPISILRDGDVILDEFVPEEMRRHAGENSLSDNFVYVRGHFYDSHPPIGPLLALPVYALPAWIGIPRNAELAANLFSKLAASLMVALSAVAMFRASRRVLTAGAGPEARVPADIDRAAMLAAITYGLATSVWSTASLAMWTHTPAVLGFACALWALTSGRAGLAGVAVAAASFARPATAPAVALLGLYRVASRMARWREQQTHKPLRRCDVVRCRRRTRGIGGRSLQLLVVWKPGGRRPVPNGNLAEGVWNARHVCRLAAGGPGRTHRQPKPRAPDLLTDRAGRGLRCDAGVEISVMPDDRRSTIGRWRLLLCATSASRRSPCS